MLQGTLQIGDATTGSISVSSPVTISGGTLAIDLINGRIFSSNVANNSLLTTTASGTNTLSGPISGTGALTQNGTGLSILTGVNSYTGATTVLQGTLQIGDGTTGSISVSSPVTISGGTLAIDLINGGIFSNNVTDNSLVTTIASGTNTLSGAINGTGALTQNGTGLSILTGTNSYSGGTTITAGTLQLGDGVTNGGITGGVTDNGTLAFDPTGSVTFGAVVTGTGDLVKLGTGTAVLTGINTYSGGTTISAGTLQIGNGGASGSLVGNVADNANLSFNLTSSPVFAGVISGAGILNQAGTGTLILTGANAYTGGTTINAGTLQIGNGGTIGSIVGNVTDNANLAFNLTSSPTFAGLISGAGTLNQAGTGTLILTGANTYTGVTTIAAGTLQIGNGGPAGAIVGNVTNSGHLVFNLTSNSTYNGVVSGVGTFTQAGTGRLILGGASSYTGATTVSAGTLEVDGSLGNTAVSVQSGAVLSGDGSIAGNVTILSGGHLAPNTTAGAQTLGVGTLLLNSGSILDYILGTPGVVGSGVNSLVSVTGNLTLAGVLNVTNGGSFGSGAYRLINYTGSLSGTTLTLGTLPAGFTEVVSTAVAGQVNLMVSSSGGPTQFWNGGTTAADGTVHGGDGTWDNFTTNFTNPAGTASQSWQNGFAIFSATAGTVTLGDNILFQGMQFTVGGYTIAGAGAFALQPIGTATITAGTGMGATISATISGTGGLNLNGAGTATLSGANTYSGGTDLDGGVLAVSSEGNLGTGGLTFNLTSPPLF